MDGSSFFQKLKQGLNKSRESWSQKLGTIFQTRRWDEESIEAMEENLLAADVGVKAAQKLMDILRSQAPGDSDAMEVARFLKLL